MKMNKFILLLAASVVLMWSCEKDNKPPDGSGEGLPFVPAEWDGVKRGNVFYEVFVRSFADKNGDGIGDLRGLTDKLDYLQSLGITGIWMMPIHPSPSYHGYDVENYKAVNPQYGTMADFDALMTKANQLGIKVVLDLVVNHTSKTHPWFKDACSSKTSPYRDFYLLAPGDSVKYYIDHNWVPSVKNYNAGEWHNVEQGTSNYRYFGGFSSWMPDINPESAVLMDSIYAAAEFWLDKGVHGFRLDAVKHVYQIERSQDNINFWKAFHARLKTVKPDVYLVGEVLDGADMVAYFYQGLPALFNFDAWWKLEWALNNNTGQYYAKDMNDCFTAFAGYNPDYLNVPKLSNHDENRTMSVLNSIPKAKVAAVVMLTMPGQPYIYYGEEIGMIGVKDNGDEYVREPFLWATKSNDTYRTTWWRSPVNTEDKVKPLSEQQQDKNSLYNVYATFIKLRNTYTALVDGTLTYPPAGTNPNELMIYTREKDGQRILVIHNLGPLLRSYTLNEEVKNPLAGINGAVLQKSGSKYLAKLPSYSSLVIELK